MVAMIRLSVYRKLRRKGYDCTLAHRSHRAHRLEKIGEGEKSEGKFGGLAN